MNYFKILTVSAGFFLLAAAAFPVLAQDSAAYDQRAVNAYNEGLDEQDAGHYASACQAFRDAAGLWENAIYGLMGQSMETETARENIKSVADSLQANADKAKSHAQNVCGQPDAVHVYNDAPDPVVQAPVEATPDDPTQETRRLYREVYLPVVTLWAPNIEKPMSESDLLALKVDELGERCEDQRSDVKKAKIRSALSAVELCLAMKYWLKDNPASTCLYLAEDPDYVRDNPDDDPEMARAYEAAGMPAIKERLRKAAACQSKSPADWNAYSIAVFNSFPSYAHAIPDAVAGPYYYECAFANSLAVDADYDAAVSTAVQEACGSTFAASDNEDYNSADIACKHLSDGKSALDALLAQRTDAPGTSEAPKIYATIARLQGDLGCASGSPQLHFGGPPVAFKRPALPGES